jgi:hypothetical protein
VQGLPDDPFDPPGPAGEEGPRGSLADGVKKAILAGVGALFLTEESARRLAREWKLPKELIGFIGQQAQGAKDEILRVFADEVRRFLDSELVRKEFWKALGENTIELRAEIRLRPNAQGNPEPKIEGSARTKRARKAKRR